MIITFMEIIFNVTFFPKVNSTNFVAWTKTWYFLQL